MTDSPGNIWRRRRDNEGVQFLSSKDSSTIRAELELGPCLIQVESITLMNSFLFRTWRLDRFHLNIALVHISTLRVIHLLRCVAVEKHNFCLVRGSLCESMTVGASLQTTVSISQKSCISIGRGKYQGWSRETADNVRSTHVRRTTEVWRHWMAIKSKTG